jgi:hypothetical protein
MSRAVRKKVKRPLSASRKLKKDRGVWVFSSGAPLSDAVVRRTNRAVRDECEKRLTNGE